MKKLYYCSETGNNIYLVSGTEDIKKIWNNILTKDNVEREYVDDAKFSLSKKCYVIKFDCSYFNQFNKILVSIVSVDSLIYLQLIDEIFEVEKIRDDNTLSRIRYIESII